MSYHHLFNSITTQNFKTLEELKEAVISTKYDYLQIPSNSLKLEESGKLSYKGGSTEIMMEGVRNLAKGLKIPDPFANRIPFDLLQNNIKRLGEELDKRVTLVLHDGVIINGIVDEYQAIPTLPLLEPFEGSDINRIEFSHLGLSIQTLSHNNEWTSEPKVGDITRLGVNLNLSETGFINPVANSLLYTLVCSNGAILPRVFGQIRIKLNNFNIEPTALTEKFQRQLNQLFSQTGRLKANLEKMPNTLLTFKKLNSLVKKVSRVTDPDTALEVFEIDEDERSEIKLKSKNYEEAYEESEINYYKAYSKITNIANNYKSTTRKRLQITAGKLLTAEELN